MTDAARPVWRGAKQLRRSLVELEGLEPSPGNPRLGDVAAIRESLRRFGQVKPILTTGKRIVAGHHVVLAAKAEGWTHVAAIENEFASEDEARAYLLADNRTHDLGDYDLELLHAQLSNAVDAPGGLAGTGYDDSHLDDLKEQIAKLHRATSRTPPAAAPPADPPPLTVEHRCPKCGHEWAGDPAPPAPE